MSEAGGQERRGDGKRKSEETREDKRPNPQTLISSETGPPFPSVASRQRLKIEVEFESHNIPFSGWGSWHLWQIFCFVLLHRLVTRLGFF